MSEQKDTAMTQPQADRGTIEFWFDYTCPYAYLASTQIEAAARRAKKELRYCPMLLGGVFQARNVAQNLMKELSPAKAKHNQLDMDRWAKKFGVRLSIPGAHPQRSVEALRVTLAAGCDPNVIRGFFEAYWVRGEGIASDEIARRVLTDAGRKDVESVLAASKKEEAKADLRERTDRAIALGIFGAPSFWVDEKDLLWGQDRMHFLLGHTFENGEALATPSTSKSSASSAQKTLEVYFDFSSPYAYLACTQIENVAKRTGARIVWRPLLLGGLFRSIGQVDAPVLTWSDAKRDYTFKDMDRWAAYWGVPFRFPSRFPTNTVKALRCYLAIDDQVKRDSFCLRAFRAYWAEDRDISDEAVLRELLGAESEQVFARLGDPEIKQALLEATQYAEKQGVFGVPSFSIDGGDLYWGQDRLSLVEEALCSEVEAPSSL